MTAAGVAMKGPKASPRDGLVRASVAVVGVAESDLGQVAPGLSPVDLMAQATMRALEDCGLKLADVDGVLAAATQARYAPGALCEYLGIKPRFFDGTMIGGSSFMTHVAHAQAAIEMGMCEVALIAYGSTQRSVSRAAASPREYNPYETPYRPLLPISAYAMAAARHMHQYGTTREQLAEVAVAARQWALLNPKAWEKEPLTVEQVLNARMVSYPFTVRDCCLVVDGGGAMILVSAKRAKALKKPPVYVLGVGEAMSHLSISNMPDLTVSAAAESGPKAFAMAGMKPADIDMLSLYDAFTITPILFLEDLGFCPKGEGGRFVSGGAIAPGGRLAVNTSGGGLSYCHPGMYGLLVMIEAVRQVRGECGKRQVKNCEVALAHGNGGVLSTQCTVIFGSEKTL
jgi:acetyl-CoA acetyltransferase